MPNAQPRQSSSHSPRIGPNMFRPMTYAPRERMSQSVAVASASLARSSPRCQAWSSRPRLPSGFSRLWSGPATKPSSEIDMWQVGSGIGVLSVSLLRLSAHLVRLAHAFEGLLGFAERTEPDQLPLAELEQP